MKQVNRIERKPREKNLRIVNYPETTGEEIMTIARSILSEKFSMEDLVVDAAHLTGRIFRLEEYINPDASFSAWQGTKTNTEF